MPEAAAPAPAGGATATPSASSNAPNASTPAGQPAASGAPPQKTATPPAPAPKPFLERGNDGRWVARGLKVDGRETELALSEDELRRTLQEQNASQKRLKEVAQEKARLNQALQMIRTDPISALSQLGVDTNGLLSQYIAQQAQLQQMTPEQREVLSARQQAAQLQAQLQAQHKQLQEAAVEQQWNQQWLPEMRQAFAEVGWGSDSEKQLAAFADLAKYYTDAGIEVPPRQLVHMVDSELSRESLSYAQRANPEKAAAIVGAAVTRLSDEALEAALGPRLEALIQRRVATIKAKRANGTAPAAPPPPVSNELKPSRFLTPDEWKKSFAK